MNRPIPSTLSVRVPFSVRKRGGRKLVITPDGATGRPRPRIDSAVVKAIARAHRWQRLLESGECGSITELAAVEKINRSYMCRMLRLTLLAPEIVEAVLDGLQAEAMTLPALMKGFPVEWEGESGVPLDPSRPSNVCSALESCQTVKDQVEQILLKKGGAGAAPGRVPLIMSVNRIRPAAALKVMGSASPAS